MLSFLHELSDYIERTIIENGKVILLRDFNFHIKRVDNMDATNFLDFLDSFGQINRVNVPTHRFANTLDLIITSEDDSSVPCTSQGHPSLIIMWSCLILAYLRREFKKKTITYRTLKNINYSTSAGKNK